MKHTAPNVFEKYFNLTDAKRDNINDADSAVDRAVRTTGAHNIVSSSSIISVAHHAEYFSNPPCLYSLFYFDYSVKVTTQILFSQQLQLKALKAHL